MVRHRDDGCGDHTTILNEPNDRHRVLAQKEQIQREQHLSTIASTKIEPSAQSPTTRAVETPEQHRNTIDGNDEMGQSFADNTSLMEASIMSSVAEDSVTGDLVALGGDIHFGESLDGAGNSFENSNNYDADRMLAKQLAMQQQGQQQNEFIFELPPGLFGDTSFT